MNVFTLLHTVSPCNWTSTYWCSLQPKYSVFFLLIFIPRSFVALLHSSSFLPSCFLYSTAHHCIVSKQHTPRGLLFDAPFHHIQYHVKQVGRGSVSFPRRTYFPCTSCSLKHLQPSYRGTLSRAFSRPINTMCNSFCISRCFSITCSLAANMASVFPLPGMKPNCCSHMLSPPSVFCRLVFPESSWNEISSGCLCNSHNPGLCPPSLWRLVQSHRPSIPLEFPPGRKSSVPDSTTYLPLLLLISHIKLRLFESMLCNVNWCRRIVYIYLPCILGVF